MILGLKFVEVADLGAYYQLLTPGIPELGGWVYMGPYDPKAYWFEFTGVLTGKGLNWGGSLIRPEATGYGAVYFAHEMLSTRDDSLEGKVCLVSGAGNVAQYTVEKLLDMGAKPVTLSDSGGFIYDPDGIDYEKLHWVMDLKNIRRGRITEYTQKFRGATFTLCGTNGVNPMWGIPADCAFPSATQNEISEKDAMSLLHGGVFVVSSQGSVAGVVAATHPS